MTSPSLFIRRLVVEGELSCDLTFENGLNVLRAVPFEGDPRTTNGAGKTALVELILHGLGKKQEAKTKWHFASISDQIETLWLQIEANSEVFTIERSLKRIHSQITVRRGPYRPGIENTQGELYDVQELSDFLLYILKIPAVSVKTANGDLEPLTFPLLMRAFVLQQKLSFVSILNKVLPERRIPDIIGFLTGITPFERFDIEEKLAKVQQNMQQLETLIQSVRKFLSETSVASLSEVEKQFYDAEQHLELAKFELFQAQQEIKQNGNSYSSRGKPGRIDSLRSQLLGIKAEKAQNEQDLGAIVQEEKRLEELHASLLVDRRKVERVKTSISVLNSVDFDKCPRCLQTITSEMKLREEHDRCCLCSRPLTMTSDDLPLAMPRTQDIGFQIEEAEMVLEDVRREKEEIELRLNNIRALEEEVSDTLDQETRTFVAPSVDHLLEQTYAVVQREAKLTSIKVFLDQLHSVDNKDENLKNLQLEKAQWEDKLKQVNRPNEERMTKLSQIYEKILKEVSFPNIQYCSIDPQRLVPRINGNWYTNPGVALTGLATVCYHLAFLELARQESTFFPLFLVVDSPNSGDLNEENQDKLLHYFAQMQLNAEKKNAEGEEGLNWQVILTTRKIVDELKPYVIEEISKAPNRMLLREQE
ncbi:hypothetical protein KSC_046190 [Ktedonobacter sp. SOSP1-52]|uniref:hypothetical protein n=1 Tax=Ktedonobacter sp. SOSP1-52 TaxID=2778366 RepID=UPI001916956E|nr:hypothetical protein [Ktedonobacter sp. SOSP1-52]GHO65727.1 hypothetical protein KSC_046190 [Ktedonobacter sp. SOSP1-52]